jgi:diaminopimelate epimerase
MKFWKMQALGNDYVVIDNRDEKIDTTQATRLAKKLCERRFSVGADGLLLVSCSDKADTKMRIFNADGSEAEMCGNGIRCFSKYCYENSIIKKNEFTVETSAGIKQVSLTIEKDIVRAVKVDMGTPNWNRKSLPMQGEGTCIDSELIVEGKSYRATCLSMGNPHCVIFVDNVDNQIVEHIGPIVEEHKMFPKRVNVGFAQVISKNEMNLRVWERGCGETLACGTGTCAAAAAANRLNKVSNKITVHLRGGDLQIEIGPTILMTGPAEKVYKATLL